MTSNQSYKNLTETTKYRVVVQSGVCSEANSSEVTIKVDTVPTVNLGEDTAICDFEHIVLNAGNSGADYLWSNGEVNQEIIVSTKGNYFVTVTNSFFCSSVASINIDINPLPKINFGSDQEICKYKPIELKVLELNAKSYLWNTDDDNQSITIKNPGKYWVDVYSESDCFNSDTIIFYPGPDLDVELLTDSVICDGNQTNIKVEVQNQSGRLDYDWNTSENSEGINVNSTGEYSVLVKDEKGCWGADTTYIRVQDIPMVSLASDTLSVCSLDEAEDSVTITCSHNGSYVEWGNGSSGDKYTSSISGFFEAYVYDDYNCVGYDSVSISEFCRPVRLSLPNVFSPNSDGYNDGFIPFEMDLEELDYLLVNLEYIDFTVYSRWGELIHSSSLVLPNWNGLNNKGFDAPDGVYFWILKYKDIYGSVFHTNGYVSLKR